MELTDFGLDTQGPLRERLGALPAASQLLWVTVAAVFREAMWKSDSLTWTIYNRLQVAVITCHSWTVGIYGLR